MTLRLRLFLAFGTFIALFVLAQWWLVRTLTRDLAQETDFLAMFVGASVAQVLTVDLNCEDSDDPSCARTLDLSNVLGPNVIGTTSIQWHDHSDADPSRVVGTSTGQGIDPGGSVLTEERRFVRVIRHSDGKGEEVESDTEEIVEQIRKHTERSNEVEDHLVHMRVTQGHGSEPIIERIGGAHGNHDISVRVGRSSGSRVLFVEQPDQVAQVPIPSPGKEALQRFQSRLWLGSAALTLLGLVLAALLSHRVSAPLRRLAAAASDLGDGALGTQVKHAGGDREIRGTLQAFNRMSERLAQLESERRRLEAAKHMGELGDVARGLAHTLRNPLNALGLSVEELARSRDDHQEPNPAGQALAESARRQIRRIDRGIRSFLLLASPGDSDEVIADRVDVAELVQDVALEAIQDMAGRVHLDLHINSNLPAEQEAVEPELRAVVQALVVNALEASPDGATVDVYLDRAEADEDRLVLQVDDQGPGLSPEVRDRLFTPHLSTKPNGSGMGLFLAHRIAGHRYDGRLELLDRESGGLRAELEFGPRKNLGTGEPGI